MIRGNLPEKAVSVRELLQVELVPDIEVFSLYQVEDRRDCIFTTCLPADYIY